MLSTLYYGGYLMTSNQLSPGDLMSFLVATQTIQRSLSQLSLLFGQYVKGQYTKVKIKTLVIRDSLRCCGRLEGL